jgi:hypothetical protein
MRKIDSRHGTRRAQRAHVAPAVPTADSIATWGQGRARAGMSPAAGGKRDRYRYSDLREPVHICATRCSKTRTIYTA